MPQVQLRSHLISRREIAERTIAVDFEKPHDFQFEAGQALDLSLPAEGGGETLTHTFSIASAPSQPHLEIGTRVRDSDFKQRLAKLPIGSTLELEGPFGSLTLHKKADQRAVMIAGGIGITPFMSILRQAAAKRSMRSFLLVTSNRRPEDAPFFDELQQLAKSLPHFVHVPTMTEPSAGGLPWDGLRETISAKLLREAVGELSEDVCYVAGSPGMVAAMKQALVAAGADEDSIRAEDFPGY